MSTRAGVGVSDHPLAARAGAEAARRALDDLAARGDRPPDLALVFATTGYPQAELVASVRQVLTPAVALVGCSLEGIISSDGSNESACVIGVMVIASDALAFRCEVFDLSRGPAACADALAAWCAGHEPATQPQQQQQLLMLLADGLSPEVAQLLEPLGARLPVDMPVVGCAAADMMRFERTYTYYGDRVLEGALIAVHLSGRFQVDIGVSHGCTAVGLEHVVTRSDGHVVSEIDGRPAWEVVRQYLDREKFDGETSSLVSVARRLPLQHATVIRSPFALDADSGSLYFAGGIAQGSAVQMTRRNAETIRESAVECARGVAARHPGQAPAFVLQFDCAGRGRLVLGNATSDIAVRAIREILGPDAPWIGGHTFAEIAPVAGQPYYHNFSVVLVAFYEEVA